MRASRRAVARLHEAHTCSEPETLHHAPGAPRSAILADTTLSGPLARSTSHPRASLTSSIPGTPSEFIGPNSASN